MNVDTTKRINVSFPADLLQELRRCIPNRQRNRFIVEATGKELRRQRLLKSLWESAGAWSDEDHPGLHGVDDVERIVRQWRGSWAPGVWAETATGAENNG